MAVQVKQAPIIPKRMAKYDFRADDIQTLADVQNEIENLGRIANESARQAYRAINSMANIVDDTFEGDGTYKKKIGSWHICEDSLDSDVMAKEVKKFATNLGFNITVAAFVSTLNCGDPIGGAGKIYWGEQTGFQHNVETIFTSSHPLVAGQTTIAYIDTADERGWPSGIGSYTVQYQNITAPSQYANVLGDGKVILCQAKPDGNPYPFRFALWGGGVWRGA